MNNISGSLRGPASITHGNSINRTPTIRQLYQSFIANIAVRVPRLVFWYNSAMPYKPLSSHVPHVHILYTSHTRDGSISFSSMRSMALIRQPSGPQWWRTSHTTTWYNTASPCDSRCLVCVFPFRQVHCIGFVCSIFGCFRALAVHTHLA